jgi:DegV family protein with EDD domain
MSRVKVMTDTVSGISAELARKFGITVVPAANIVYDGQFFPDGVGISPQEAYRLLEQDADKFSASTLNPGYLLDIYREVSKESDSILFISFSYAFSAAGKIAALAADLLRQESPQVDIRVVDSKTAAGAQGLLAIAAAKAAARGMDLDRVIELTQRMRSKTVGLMMLDTLRYVYRTGRMSKTASRIASFFNIKPINRMTDEGTMELVDRVRKREDGYRKLMGLIKKEAKTDALHFMVSHASAPQMGETVTEMLRQNFNCLSLHLTEYSPIMGYAAGPGCIFIGFQPEMDSLKW